jgi:hypothetical protein
MSVRAAWVSAVALGATLILQSPAGAILIETAPNQRVGGFFEREDANRIYVRIKLPDGKDKVQAFEKTKIKILHRVDRDRLEKLTKDRPKAYRDYAEELATKKTDPEAVEVALRLFLIAAYLDPPNLGRNCLMSMSSLAATPAEQRKYRAMAYLLDPKSDQSLLKLEPVQVGPPTSPEGKAAAKALSEFQKALKNYRSGQIKAAREYSNEKGVSEYFRRAGLGDHKTFLQACTDLNCTKCKTGAITCATCSGKGTTIEGFEMRPCAACSGKGKQKCSTCDGTSLTAVPEDYLKAVLRAEIWALDQMLPADVAPPKKTADGSWSRALHNQQSPIPQLALEMITEFDPRQCAYRNGKWTLP